jgi:hypothetical protein
MFTRDQAAAFQRLKLLGEVYFQGPINRGLLIAPRLCPLIAGPTGAGKTMLVKKVADALGAKIFRITHGDWMPRGVRSETGTATTFHILKCLQENPRVVLHIDELDKCSEDFQGTWARSVASDLWNVLDREFPIDEYLASSAKSNSQLLTEGLSESVQRRLWIVGSGTWQSVFNKMSAPTVGFKADRETTAATDGELTDMIVRERMIPDELLARFASDLVFLRYPNSRIEKQALVDGLGLTALAKKLGETLDVTHLDFDRKGLRILETLATRLILKAHVIEHGCRTETAIPRESPIMTELLKKIVRPTERGVEETFWGNTDESVAVFPLTEKAPDVNSSDLPRWVYGKALSGWAKQVVSDPVMEGFNAWCASQGYPPWPGTSACVDNTTREIPVVSGYPQPLGSPQELFAVLRQGIFLRKSRLLDAARYHMVLLPKLGKKLAAEFDERERWCTSHGLFSGAGNDFLGSYEIARQTRAHAIRGSLLALDWQSQHANGRVDKQSLRLRLCALWSRAIRVSQELQNWDGVCEYFMVPNGVQERIDALPESATWTDIDGPLQLEIGEMFEVGVLKPTS